MRTVITGAGCFVPKRIVKNKEICCAVPIPAWSADKLAAKTGIQERRALWRVHEYFGLPIDPSFKTEDPDLDDDGEIIRSGADMSRVALLQALDMAGLKPSDVDCIIMVTCTPDEINFTSDTMFLSDRLGMNKCYIIQVDSGCGGAQYYLKLARDIIEGGIHRRIALVAHNLTSALVNRDMYTKYMDLDGKMLGAFLSPYIFGDGAGALIVEAADGDVDEQKRGFISSFTDQRLVRYMIRPGGGGMKPPHSPRTDLVDHAFIIDGKLVGQEFPVFMGRALKGVIANHRHLQPQIHRYFLHQANMLLVQGFARQIRLPMDRVPLHMDRYGNTSAAGTLILFAEDLVAGNVSLGSGQLVLFAAIGAGAHYASHLIRL